ncbi:Uncharacterised protein [Pseudomonas putida]|nr:Uncharacterised protein [Pseudomonas putida]
MPANTGEAGAIYRVACFAGMPACMVRLEGVVGLNARF